MKMQKKEPIRLTLSSKIVVSLMVLSVISITTQLYVMSSNRAINNELSEVKQYISDTKEDINSIKGEIQAIHDHQAMSRLNTLDFIDVHQFVNNTDILVTNYWIGDGSSGDITASGLSSKDFKVNEDGMYTYNGKIVVATSNTTRLKRPLYKGYKSHELYDELTLTFNDKTYGAVVLDVCGSCYGVTKETSQRYDVFTSGNVIGKVKGILHE